MLKKGVWKMSIFLFAAYFNANPSVYFIIGYINRLLDRVHN